MASLFYLSGGGLVRMLDWVAVRNEDNRFWIAQIIGYTLPEKTLVPQRETSVLPLPSVNVPALTADEELHPEAIPSSPPEGAEVCLRWAWYASDLKAEHVKNLDLSLYSRYELILSLEHADYNPVESIHRVVKVLPYEEFLKLDSYYLGKGGRAEIYFYRQTYELADNSLRPQLSLEIVDWREDALPELVPRNPDYRYLKCTGGCGYRYHPDAAPGQVEYMLKRKRSPRDSDTTFLCENCKIGAILALSPRVNTHYALRANSGRVFSAKSFKEEPRNEVKDGSIFHPSKNESEITVKYEASGSDDTDSLGTGKKRRKRLVKADGARKEPRKRVRKPSQSKESNTGILIAEPASSAVQEIGDSAVDSSSNSTSALSMVYNNVNTQQNSKNVLGNSAGTAPFLADGSSESKPKRQRKPRVRQQQKLKVATSDPSSAPLSTLSLHVVSSEAVKAEAIDESASHSPAVLSSSVIESVTPSASSSFLPSSSLKNKAEELELPQSLPSLMSKAIVTNTGQKVLPALQEASSAITSSSTQLKLPTSKGGSPPVFEKDQSPHRFLPAKEIEAISPPTVPTPQQRAKHLPQVREEKAASTSSSMKMIEKPSRKRKPPSKELQKSHSDAQLSGSENQPKSSLSSLAGSSEESSAASSNLSNRPAKNAPPPRKRHQILPAPFSINTSVQSMQQHHLPPSSLTLTKQQVVTDCAAYITRLEEDFNVGIKELMAQNCLNCVKYPSPRFLATELMKKLQEKAQDTSLTLKQRFLLIHNNLQRENSTELRCRVLTGEMSLSQLVNADAQSLAPSSLQKERAEWQEKSFRQNVLVSSKDQGPIVRKTHKGLEIIEAAVDQSYAGGGIAKYPEGKEAENSKGKTHQRNADLTKEANNPGEKPGEDDIDFDDSLSSSSSSSYDDLSEEFDSEDDASSKYSVTGASVDLEAEAEEVQNGSTANVSGVQYAEEMKPVNSVSTGGSSALQAGSSSLQGRSDAAVDKSQLSQERVLLQSTSEIPDTSNYHSLRVFNNLRGGMVSSLGECLSEFEMGQMLHYLYRTYGRIQKGHTFIPQVAIPRP